ncbi:uncharacterized protein LOC129599399 [Paramacrobiotus metropolitanus]|uniref:uncharacterized protein LOC129599399 n=1 Tax=Paramacrobiotus metropolitanus TaxID=2943436 RepID=UPI002445B2D1|nr:uncharacterized protein LOC129599399 [Paramacrobiotus metropolitanus]
MLFQWDLNLFVIGALLTLGAADDIRVEFQLLDFTNKARALTDGTSKCPVKSFCTKGEPTCNIRLSRAVDKRLCPESSDQCFSSPITDPKFMEWRFVFYKGCSDQALVNRTLSLDNCNKKFQETKLQLKVIHQEKFNSAEDKDMQIFDCLTSGNAADVASNKRAAKWSQTKQCAQKYNKPENAKLSYQWRAYKIPKEQCGAEPKEAPFLI